MKTPLGAVLRKSNASLRFLLATKRRIALVVAVTATVVAIGAPLAAAAFSAHTTESQHISAGTYRWAVTGGAPPTSGPPALLPGTPPQAFTFTIQDTGTLHASFVNSDLSATVTPHVAGCPPSDFVTAINTHGATGTTLSPGGKITVTVSVGLNTTVTANACEGSSPTVTLTIRSTD